MTDEAPDTLDQLATLAGELELTLELRHPGHHLWRLQAVSDPSAVAAYRHWGQRRAEVVIDGPLTWDAFSLAVDELTSQLRTDPPTDDMGQHDPRRDT